MNVDLKKEPTIAFKFKQKLLFAILMVVVVVTILSGSIIGYVRQGSGFGMLIVAFVISLLCMFICYLVFIGRSDVRVDDTSISRVLFGKVIRSIKWDNVNLIRVSPLAKWDSRKQVSAYNIWASSVETTSPRTRRIYFGDYDTDVHELIGVMNYYINKYRIPVERIVDGKRVSVDSI
jgi:hypothetical protein